jgi:hypothetical protein
MTKIDIKLDKKTKDNTVDCPLHNIDVIVGSACKNCRYFHSDNDGYVSCEYSDRFVNKISSTYPTDNVYPKAANDIIGGGLNSQIALDTLNRDIHEPSIEDLAEYFGFSLRDITDSE